MKTVTALLFTFFLTFHSTFAQGESAIPFLNLPTSPESFALGWSGVSLPNNDGLGFYYNPALLGYSAKSNNLSAQFYTEKVNWFNDWNLEVRSFGFTAGYLFENLIDDLDLKAGAGFIKSKMEFGKFYNSPGNFSEPFDEYSAFGFGASIKYYIDFSAGFNIKNVYSHFGDYPTAEGIKTAETNVTALDWGIHLGIPVIDLFNYNWHTNDEFYLRPKLNIFLGYSRLNIGKEVYYLDPKQSDPIGLTARLGYTLNFGLDYYFNNSLLNFFNYDMILEANDILIKRDASSDAGYRYQGLIGDIKLKNLIWQGSEGIILHRSHKIDIFEIVSLMYGAFRGRDFHEQGKAAGYALYSTGLFKLLSNLLKSETFEMIVNHFELKYISAVIFKGSKFESDIKSINISLRNFRF